MVAEFYLDDVIPNGNMFREFSEDVMLVRQARFVVIKRPEGRASVERINC